MFLVGDSILDLSSEIVKIKPLEAASKTHDSISTRMSHRPISVSSTYGGNLRRQSIA